MSEPPIPSAYHVLARGEWRRKVSACADLVERDMSDPVDGKTRYNHDADVSMQAVLDELIDRGAIRRVTPEERARYGDAFADFGFVHVESGDLLRFRETSCRDPGQGDICDGSGWIKDYGGPFDCPGCPACQEDNRE